MPWLFQKKRPHTLVYVFYHSSPLDRWQSIVVYDAWGNPTVRHPDLRGQLRCQILEDGTTDRAVGWKFKSGPAIDFPQAIRAAA